MGLKKYIGKRVVIAFLTLFIVMNINFLIFRVFSPVSDPSQLIWDPRMPPGSKEALRELWGLSYWNGTEWLDTPLFPNQYLSYLYNLFTWNYGLSLGTIPTSVSAEMSWRLRNTILILGFALIGQIALGIPLGLLAGSRRGSKVDVVTIGTGLFTWGVPTFFIQILFVLIFTNWWSATFGWPLFASGGVLSSPPPPPGTLAYVTDLLWHTLPPILTLTIAGFGSWALYNRNMILDAMTEDFVMTARAKGVKERDVIYRHAFRSILPPIITIIAMSIPGIVTGAIITEYIFSWPGIGAWYITAIQNNNYPVAQAVLYNYAFLMIVANLVADFLYGVVDPRIRVGMRR
jgi:peptide/nickel transport system permease protein